MLKILRPERAAENVSFYFLYTIILLIVQSLALSGRQDLWVRFRTQGVALGYNALPLRGGGIQFIPCIICWRVSRPFPGIKWSEVL